MAGDFTPTGVDAQVQNLSKFLSDLGRMDKGMQQTGSSASGVSKSFNSLGKGILGIGKIAAGAAVVGIGALGAGIAAAGVASVKTAISFESAFAGVTKTVDGLTSSVGKLNDQGKELREGFVNLTKEVPLAFEELAAIGELGGQLGIGKDALLDFTETVAGLGVTTNLTTEEAGAGLARLSNIFNVSQDQMGKNISQLGSTLVDLGNNFATTERDILAFGERLAGAGAIAGLTQADVLAIGAAMSSVGVQAEAGGTATQKVLLAINNAVVGATTGFVDYTKEIDKNVGKLTKLNAESARLEAQFPGLQAELLAQKEAFLAAGGSAEEFGRQLGDKTRQKALEVAEGISTLQAETDLLRQQHGQPIDSKMLSNFARTANLSATEFQELWREDASEAFRLFVEGLGAQGDDAINTLSELGLTDQRLIRSFLSLSGAGDLLERTLKTGNQAFDENNALANEAAQRYATTESQLAILKNTLRAIGDSIGSQFLPILNQLITSGKGVIEQWAVPLAAIIEQSVVPAIKNAISSVQTIITLFNAFGAAGAAKGILSMLGIDPALVNTAITVIANLRNTFAEAMPFIQATVQTAGTVIAATFSTVMGIIQATAPAFQQAFDNITMALASLGISWTDVWNAVKTATILVVTGIGALLLGLVATVTGIVVGISGAIQVLSQGFVNLVSFIEQAVTGIIQIIIGLREFFVGIFTGDMPRVLEGFLLVFEGIGNALQGIFGGMITTVTTGISAIIALIGGFVSTVVEFFSSLSNTLVGNSIVPDMVQAILDTFTSLVSGITNILGGITETIGGIFGSLFGGGDAEGPAISFNPAEMLTGIDAVNAGIANINTGLTNISTVTLIMLQEAFILTATMVMQQLLLLLQTGIMPVNMALVMIATVTLPNLQAVTIAVSAAMVAAFVTVQNILNILLSLANALAAAFIRMGQAAITAGKNIEKGFKDAKKRIQGLITVVGMAVVAFNKLAEAAKRAISATKKAGKASKSAGGLGFDKGIGFRAGTPANTNGILGLGFKIPQGFPNDSFGPLFAQSGEEMLITPRGTSIDSLIFSRLADIIGNNQVADRPVVTNITNNFDMTVNTGASPQAVVGQFNVMRGFIGT